MGFQEPNEVVLWLFACTITCEQASEVFSEDWESRKQGESSLIVSLEGGPEKELKKVRELGFRPARSRVGTLIAYASPRVRSAESDFPDYAMIADES